MTAIVRLRLPEDDAVFGGNRVFDAFEYSPAVVARGMAYISGQVGVRPDGTLPETAREQIEWAFKRAEAILRRLGLDFSDVVEMVSYHVDVNAQLADFREIKSRYMKSDFPAWTILGVAELARPALAVEIRFVAATR